MTGDLFSHSAESRLERVAPLAQRLRPGTIDEFVGQVGVVGEGSALRRAIAKDRIPSMIFYGPPGSGKTTLARIVAHTTEAHFEELSAVQVGVADVRRVLGEARDRLGANGQRTILFLDEIHRFNKGQQDALLPGVEDRTVVLVGATTENPFFTVNAPLMSRSLLFRLEPLGIGELETIVTRALADPERGLGGRDLTLDDDALAHLVDRADGDARHALNALEAAALVVTAKPGGSGGPQGGPPESRATRITLADIEDALQRPRVTYDRAGDQHYDVASAFIKSIRGSDPDAALHYLARMLAAGEDPRFIARRLVISASEDVGLADPQALPVAVAAFQALEFVGLPEARLNLAEAVVYLALAPKSNSAYAALGEATRELEEARPGRVPSHLQSASYPGERKLGIGVGYVYPHDHPDHWVAQRYLPEGLRGGYYRPSDQGQEARLAEAWRRRRGQPPDPPADGDPDGRPDRQERG
ncbi:MAG: replication-associated recombination protein A [Actinomycetes bacterium]